MIADAVFVRKPAVKLQFVGWWDNGACKETIRIYSCNYNVAGRILFDFFGRWFVQPFPIKVSVPQIVRIFPAYCVYLCGISFAYAASVRHPHNRPDIKSDPFKIACAELNFIAACGFRRARSGTNRNNTSADFRNFRIKNMLNARCFLCPKLIKRFFEILSEINLCFFVCSVGVKLFPFNNAVCHRRIFPRTAVVECRLRDRYSQKHHDCCRKYCNQYANLFAHNRLLRLKFIIRSLNSSWKSIPYSIGKFKFRSWRLHFQCIGNVTVPGVRYFCIYYFFTAAYVVHIRRVSWQPCTSTQSQLIDKSSYLSIRDAA